MFQIGKVPNINDLAWILGCKVGSLPSSYRGLLLGANFKSKRVWGPVLDRISTRLDSWKAALLSKGGKLTLLKSTLCPSQIIIYLCLLFLGWWQTTWNPSFVHSWGMTRGDHHRYHLVAWKSICRPLGCGGLGLRSIKDHNRVILATWFWRYGMAKESLANGGGC